MNRFDRIQIGNSCPRHADRRVITKGAGTIECAPYAQPLEFVRAAKTAQTHDLTQIADDPEAAADFELALEMVLR